MRLGLHGEATNRRRKPSPSQVGFKPRQSCPRAGEVSANFVSQQIRGRFQRETGRRSQASVVQGNQNVPRCGYGVAALHACLPSKRCRFDPGYPLQVPRWCLWCSGSARLTVDQEVRVQLPLDTPFDTIRACSSIRRAPAPQAGGNGSVARHVHHSMGVHV